MATATKATRTKKTATSKPAAPKRGPLIPYPERWANFPDDDKATLVGEELIAATEALTELDEPDRERLRAERRDRIRVVAARLASYAQAQATLYSERRALMVQLALLGETQAAIADYADVGNMVVNEALGITKRKR